MSESGIRLSEHLPDRIAFLFVRNELLKCNCSQRLLLYIDKRILSARQKRQGTSVYMKRIGMWYMLRGLWWCNCAFYVRDQAEWWWKDKYPRREKCAHERKRFGYQALADFAIASGLLGKPKNLGIVVLEALAANFAGSAKHAQHAMLKVPRRSVFGKEPEYSFLHFGTPAIAVDCFEDAVFMRHVVSFLPKL